MSSRLTAEAPGKVILVGEHAVVYGRPAIAIPLTEVVARAHAEPGRPHTGVVIHARSLRRRYMLAAAPDQEPLAFTCRSVLRHLGIDDPPNVRLTLESEIPIASGLGSGAATAAAMARALARFLGWEPTAEELSALVYETEKLHHGTPSGIDNSVVAHQRPIWFVRDQPVAPIAVGAPLTFLVADSGTRSPTRETVAGVRERWQAEPERYERLFDQIGQLSHGAREAIEQGDEARLGTLMTENQALLAALGVSASANEQLAEAALEAGALGAKLSGGGGGGNNVALVQPTMVERVRDALQVAGARQVLVTTLPAGRPILEEIHDA